MQTIDKLFPIINSRILQAVPLEMLDGLEHRCLRNHGQAIAQLAARGGLSEAELVAVLTDKSYTDCWPQGCRSVELRREAERRVLCALASHIFK